MVQPFVIDVPQQALDDLRARLRRSRLCTLDNSWDLGTPAGYLRDLIDYWAEQFDWRDAERRLCRLPQFSANVGQFRLHFVHALGTGPRPLPLLFTHGWPGSFWEVHKILGPLTDPAAYGGDPADAFDVIAPSLPGFGFSPHPPVPGVDSHAIAAAFHRLMTEALGYRRFVARAATGARP
jgi:epoxide hydrolase